MGISFDGTLSAGSILNALVLFIGFVVAFTRIGGRIDILSLRIKNLEQAVADTQSIDKRLATIEERVTNHSGMIISVSNDTADLRKVSHDEVHMLRQEFSAFRQSPLLKPRS